MVQEHNAQFNFSAGQPFLATDVYADAFQMSVSAYTVSLLFALQVGEGQLRPQAIVRMSPLHAKLVAIQLKRALKGAEEQIGAIAIPEAILTELGIDLERDW